MIIVCNIESFLFHLNLCIPDVRIAYNIVTTIHTHVLLQNEYISPVLKQCINYIKTNKNLSIGLLTEIKIYWSFQTYPTQYLSIEGNNVTRVLSWLN